MKIKSDHAGHRDRMRQKFSLENNTESYPSHVILEMLLFYSIPVADTNNLAHALINAFGSLKGVFDADYNQLLKVKGVGDRTATLIKLLPAVMQRYQEESLQTAQRISSTADAINIVRPKFIGKSDETMILICINNDGKILKISYISSGGSTFTKVDIRRITQELLLCKASSAIIVHNHPSGLCVPSAADILATNQIYEMLKSINTKLVDHIIITPDSHYSMAESQTANCCFSKEAHEKEKHECSTESLCVYEINLGKEGNIK